MTNDIVYGVEKIEFGISNGDDSVPASVIVFNNIEDGSVSYTSNKDTATSITPEDKDVPILVLYTPGDADTFNFNLLELSKQNLQALFNTVYDEVTSKFTILATKAHSNLWIRLTTRPQFGVKKVFIFPNTICDVSYKNNFTKNALVAIAVVASILAYNDADGNVCAYTIQKVNADGTTIDGTTPTVNAGIDQSVTVNTATVTGVATPDGSNTIVSKVWTKKSGGAATITTPNALSTTLTGLANGVYVFTLTITDNEGNINSDDVQITVAIAA